MIDICSQDARIRVTEERTSNLENRTAATEARLATLETAARIELSVVQERARNWGVIAGVVAGGLISLIMGVLKIAWEYFN